MIEAMLPTLPAMLAQADAEPSALHWLIQPALELGIAVLVLGMVLCVYRIWRGPRLPDRVIGSDALALHVVGLVIVLAMYLRTDAFLDVALVVAIIGFAGTLAFAQYIGAMAGRRGAES